MMKRITVKYPGGFETEYNEDVAKILIDRGSVELVKKSPGRNKKAEEPEGEPDSDKEKQNTDKSGKE
jgi:hypothetical protein